ncbi:MAG: hypothetical protein ACREEM_07020 [Blastocatellia bacterium]
MNGTVSPEFTTLREKVESQEKILFAQGREISELRGSVQQIDKIVAATTRQSIWQLIALIATLSGTILGAMIYLTHTIDKRFEQIEKNQLLHREAIEKRIELSEKNMSARFEDLKQEVRNQRNK